MIRVLLLVVASLIFTVNTFAQTAGKGSRATVSLNTGWQFREAGKTDWHTATVPGCVHTDLLNNKLIEDPFYRDNEKKLQWIGKTDWQYQTTFNVTPQLFARENIELVFQGLDTYATVSLNGAKILSADNMFRTWRVDCKKFLKSGANTLEIVFRSPINEILPLMKTIGYELPASNDQGEKTSPYTRKAPYQFGWDWGPRFVTSGVWRPVNLEAWDAARIDDFHLTQSSLNSSQANLIAQVEVRSNAASDAVIEITNGNARIASQPVKLKQGINQISVPFIVSSPKLWWPNGLGSQNLYTFSAQLKLGSQTVDQSSKKIGLRTLELRQKPDQWGKSFEFVINGVAVFAKGGNWIPADSFPTRMTTERYRQLIGSVRDSNMNMLRVWGGGIYESDDFYNLCDEMGIMVWQEFMFACSMYPGDQPFLDNVRQEAIDNVKHLRSHACLVLWCGNNEIETAWQHWGWKQNLPAKLWDDYKKIFHGVLPEVVAEYDPATPYWPSSPSSNLEDDPDSQKMGDVHYWQVWHASAPFTEYEKQWPRFMSEYGFQSFPQIETVNTYTVPEDHDIQSPVMMAHQRHPRGNQLVREYMLRDYNEPKDFESFLYISQVLQAEGIKIGAEHLRRAMPRNMGSLYWQIDDCWQVASWSSIDYFGRWKALQYYAKRFYQDILVSPHEEDGNINVYVVSDRTKSTHGTLKATLMNFDGKVVSEKSVAVDVQPINSVVYLKIPKTELLTDRDPKSVFLNCELSVDGSTIASNRMFFVPFKDRSIGKADIKFQTAATAKGFKITLTSGKLAESVYLSTGKDDGFFKDNYFDLLPGKTVSIEFQPKVKMSVEEFRKNLKVKSL